MFGRKITRLIFVCLLVSLRGEIAMSRKKGSTQADRFRPLLSPLSLSPVSRKTAFQNFQGDRFIPTRSAMDLDIAQFNLRHETKENGFSAAEVASPVKEEYKRKLAENLLHDSGALQSPKILAFNKRPSPLQLELHDTTLDSLSSPSKQHPRQVPRCPERILDAPDIVDDYYLNLLDWSSSNIVAVALGPAVYLWDAETSGIHRLTNAEDRDYITSVSWAQDGTHIAVGLESSEIQIWDISRSKQVRRLCGHSSRVGSLAWNGHTLSSGGRDNLIINHDVRVREHRISHVTAHTQEVCGLKWSPSGQQLASGGNDNLLHIWDSAVTSSSFDTTHNQSQYLFRWNDHRAAVKALAWCPFQSHLLASGGGTADRCIKFWNTQAGTLLNSIDTYSQVCALQWNKQHKEIISSHGFSQNQLCLWKYPSMLKVAELKGHTARVLHLAQSPDGTTVVSAAADETLRFWKTSVSSAFPNRRSRNNGAEPSGLLLKGIHIR